VATYRSKYEARIAKNSPKDISYETLKLKWIPPIKVRTYTPDFILPNGIIVEAKGRFTASDRAKMLCVIEQNPSLDIRMLFMNSNVKLSKVSKTSYAMWCDKNNIKWADGDKVPTAWLKEKKK